ncbi:MAG TPA: SCO family protein [Bacteroidia bacterium]|nr:SCO family protein [Bacteroidia bacterium]
MKTFILSGMFFLFLFSCNTGNEKVENTFGGIERLAIYYPLDSVGANGEKLYHVIPDVQLIAQNGKSFSTSSVKEKITLSDFFFASCQGTCPRMTSQLTRVQAAFPNNPDFKIVSYTVDPARDSAQSLQAYAEHFKADTSQWKFVTGPKKSLYDLARYGFYLPVQPGTGDSEDFIHSDQLILSDRNMHIRGYYSGTDSAAVDSLISDIKILLQEKK